MGILSPNPDAPKISNREQCQQMLVSLEKAKQAKVARGADLTMVQHTIDVWLDIFRVHTIAGTLDDEFVPTL